MAVTRLEITSLQPFAEGQSFGEVGTYEQLDGIVYFSVDPELPANDVVTDLKLAPRNSSGSVEFSADFRMLRPTDPRRGNHRLFFDILNRGRGPVLRNINSAPDVAASEPLNPGNGFLMREGYTVAYCGWQHDAPDVLGSMRLYGPDAVMPDGPVSGKIVITLQLNAPSQVEFLSNRMHRAYPTVDPQDPDAVLTEQDDEDAQERVIPRDQWSFSRPEDGQAVTDASYVNYPSGFIPGKVYQVIYTTSTAPIVGLGLLATRDCGSFLRYGTAQQGNPCDGDIEHSYSFGVSQSGRFLRSLLYYGLNQDEADRTVFDGLIPHVGGGKQGEFNHRFAQASSQASRSPNSLFPFSDVEQTDALTGQTDGLLSRLTAKGKVPKIMYTYTPSEYWGGHGALVHVDLTGTRDLEVPPEVRIYHIAGTQHGLGAFPFVSEDVNGSKAQQFFNCLDYRPLLRAAVVNLNKWVTSGEPPPASKYPRIDDGTAVAPESLSGIIEAIPGMNFPHPLRRFTRLDFGPQVGIASNAPPIVGEAYPVLVPNLDQDGNEVCGVGLPFQTVPLATHTGWNLRHADMGGEGQILSSGGASGGTLTGSTVPFPATCADREVSGDPRLSIEERYSSRQDYLERITQASKKLISEGYVLSEDFDRIVEQAGQHYDLMRGRVKQTQAADD